MKLGKKNFAAIMLCMLFAISPVTEIYAATSPTVTVTTGNKTVNGTGYFTVTGRIEYPKAESYCASYGYLSAGYSLRGSVEIYYSEPYNGWGNSYGKTWLHTHDYEVNPSSHKTYVKGRLEAHYKDSDGVWHVVYKYSA